MGAVEEAMEPLAKKYKAEAKAAGEEDPKFAFTIVTENSGLAPRLRGMFKIEAEDGKTLPPKLMIVDIPDEGGFYEGPEGDVTAAVVQKLLDDYSAKALERKQLE